MTLGVWVRNAFVAFHLMVITFMSLPAPVGGMSKKLWASEEGQEQLVAWTEGLNRVGIPVTRDALEDFAWTNGKRILDTRTAILKPLLPYFRHTGTRQSWRMFAVVSKKHARLQVFIDEGDGWQPLYLAGESGNRWRLSILEQERTRALISDFAYLDSRSTYRGFVARLADMAKEDFPHAVGLKVQMMHRTTPAPGQSLGALKQRWKTEVDL